MTKVNSLDWPDIAAQQLGTLPLFADVRTEQLRQLAQNVTPLELGADEFLFHEGAEAEWYYLVVKGSVEVLRYGLDGEERVFNAFGMGRLVAIAAMFMQHGRYPMHARARGETVCLRLERKPLGELCLQAPQVALKLLNLLSSTVYQHVNEVEWLTASSAPQRLALYLLRLSEEQGDDVTLPLSQRQLASRLGVRAETLSRLFADWQARGYVEGRGREWGLRDRPFLRQLTHAAARAF
ncbi:Crp/Fnr family transcriptional regulator (plasmid) [Diaphorobacter sp. HDW4B]|uniref:Crp/Fnr family transcriptional regulator n=1 Tax=Diaphorobacter sp. HDW4B TaxID=2714925 RepID=UPI00140A7778|nr:Crp/Fnr family transcriptional regulator [Diaphorobacter sp. HDW4B]QIL74336.1 Crp/Fnr family transcriptional regulator [Diaphorobacter sp. HDW4B]